MCPSCPHSTRGVPKLRRQARPCHRPNRAWETAQIALDAGAAPHELQSFLRHLDFNGYASRHRRAFATVILTHHVDEPAPQTDWDDIALALLSAPDRARYHLTAAKTALRQGHKSAAVIELSKAANTFDNGQGVLLSRSITLPQNSPTHHQQPHSDRTC